MTKYQKSKGKLKRIPVDKEYFAKKNVKETELPSYYNTWLECLLDNYNFIMLNEELYEIQDEKLDDEAEYFKMSEDMYGNLTYEVRYRDGDRDLGDAINFAYENI
jgi:hypothetical protein